MIGSVAGPLTLLSALAMGLLIWTAYGVYAGQNAAIQGLAAGALQLDLALATRFSRVEADQLGAGLDFGGARLGACRPKTLERYAAANDDRRDHSIDPETTSASPAISVMPSVRGDNPIHTERMPSALR
jgi:hypothetical protein